MRYPDFFDAIETIKIKDNLGETLGSFNGELEFSYLDCVKMAGHSCPTLAGAYLSALYGLKAIHNKNEIPMRGNIRVDFKDENMQGVIGVNASVLSFITGARENDGFKGISGKFCRNGLMFFNQDIQGEIRLTRLDNGKSVETSYLLNSLVVPELNQDLFQKVISEKATPDELKAFGAMWQTRVKEILTVHKEQAIKLIY